ncbi:sensor histidine kinase [Chryseosolibacter indicus]|uniref:histidine kinase n=1 Tax=Chryseosolibacter indicus TaxID=2782351 RepID=A0ABS5VUG1_9BACT|nr:ATP-binding protein [Chryseosolibacter indicus]MBT1705072.1 CHASE3 domain-containing protein [Chryseosolibacter indicus]
MESSKRIIYSRIIFTTGIVLLTSLSVLFIYETYQENTASNVVYRTSLIRQSLEEVFAALNERESALRGFALTADRAFLTRDSLVHPLNKQISILDSLINDSIQQQNLLQLKEKLDYCINRLNSQSLRLKDKNYFNSNQFYTDLKDASVCMDSVEAMIRRMQDLEENSSRGRTLEAQAHTVMATIIGVAVSIFSMIVFILAFYFIDQELKRSQNYINETQTLNSKIAEINKELEEANRSLHDLNSELEDKNFQLEKYATELSSFTHITSHDMQEPLRKIEFYISIVEDREKENLTEEGQKFFEKIKQSVGRMRQLFISMLDFSLTNTVDNNIEDVDLNNVLQQTLNSLKVYIKDTNAIIESEPLPQVKGIKYQLIQLFENIVSNAIKFRKNDVIPEIHISVELVSTRQNLRGLKNGIKYYRIDFRDNGIGFEPKYAERIFEIFQRLIAKQDSYGVGIGLAICRKIAENHGGILVASSQPNVGSVFSFYIPESK